MIDVKGISYAYGKNEILKDISFKAEEGDVVGILGNNGAGKSTLIKCINKILKPKTGEVYIDDKNVFDLSRTETARNIAYVAQKTDMTQITVYDAVLLGRKPYMKWGLVKEDYDICDEMISLVGLDDYKLRFVNELSGGEAQKVVLARALVQKPKLLLLDEPTSNLDPRNQYEMMKLVSNLAKEKNITVFVVIHDLNLALRYCNKFMFVKDGNVFDYGDMNVVTEDTLRSVYGINATLVNYDGKAVAIIE